MKKLQQRLERKKNQIGLVGTRLNFSRPQNGRGINEHITSDWKEVVIQIRKDLDLAPDEQTRRYLQKVSVEEPVEAVATDLLYHGCGHRELPSHTGMGCPHTVENHDQILDGVAQALKEKGKSGLESYLANAFEDVLDNVNARRHTRHAGQILFWNNEGLENDGFLPFYEAFVKINLTLMGSVEDATLLRRFYTNDEKVQQAVHEFKDYLKQQLNVDYLVKLYEDESLTQKLFDKKKWRDLAYRFTLATADLLEEQPQMRMCFGIPADGENLFDKLIKLPQVQEELAYGRYQAGEGPSEHAEPQLQLDALYRKISRSIPVKTSEYTKSQGIPIAHYGKRNLREDETIRLKRMKGVGFDDQGKLTVKMARHDLQHPAHYKVRPRNFPSLKVAIIDTSGSMAQSPDEDGNIGDTSFIPWGDNSKYHYALKGIYGIDNFLEKQGISRYVKSEVVVFGGSTYSTGKQQMRNEAERRALLRMPSGGTTIDASVLQSDGRSFVVSISDGDIPGWGGIKESYRQAVQNADYCHLHIGRPNQFTHDLESWGVPVHYVKGDDDLSGLLLDLTSTYYKKGVFTP